MAKSYILKRLLTFLKDIFKPLLLSNSSNSPILVGNSSESSNLNGLESTYLLPLVSLINKA